MKLFLVPAGTEVKVHKEEGAPHYDTKDWVTKQENTFNLEDVVIDPVGSVGSHRGHAVTIGGHLARCGYYGFKRGNWTLLVPADKVTIL